MLGRSCSSGLSGCRVLSWHHQSDQDMLAVLRSAIAFRTATFELALAQLLHSLDWELPPGIQLKIWTWKKFLVSQCTG
ncbi:cytochrome P450 71A1-like [Pyrus ussuriensis x Pyrus communis]|uniref:Cytochrome P450 71A1-like n=1 Tax=Pyrus ussuriensis x Pyrus communis TaxID=2448454 RepID=A0A5N5HZC3_9ROSA|nr:cytochrome P450 71A1-like [Pyrus ussuriensis x Pyrus communis]